MFHHNMTHLEAAGDYEQVLLCYADFPHRCRPSYQHPLHTKVVAGVVYVNLTFTSRSSLTFPPTTTTEMELLAVLPYMAGQRGLPRLIGTTAVTRRMGKWQGRWLRGMASGSVPSLPGPVKGQGWGALSLSALIKGQPSISHHQS